MSDHETLIAVARRWEALYKDEWERVKELARDLVERDTQIAALKAALKGLYDAQSPQSGDVSGDWLRRYNEACAAAAGLLTEEPQK